MKTIYFSILLLFSILLYSCGNEELPLPNDSTYTNAQTFFEDLKFRGAVLISKNNNDILRTGFGEANSQTGELNNDTTKFRIGSVSKTLTGMGIVQLIRDGLITGLDQYLSDFDADFPNGNSITIRHLLSHQSGIPDYVPRIEGQAKSGQSFTSDDIYNEIKNAITENGLDFAPGTEMHYSNSNFLIAAVLIEQLSGKTYSSFIKQHVLEPLQMNDTEMGNSTIGGSVYAQGYNGSNNVSNYPMNITLGAGCWTSTVGDMEKWCKAAMGDNWFTAAEKKAIFESDIPMESTIFGLAWFNSNIFDKTFHWHGGDIDGFSALIGFVPQNQGIIIALSNEQDDTAQKRNKIIETILNEEF
ncbi:serine hydrolase domain-containing protein [uncultured Draconibacterium sp.]|uniref:serine hydrolase domain-containing protein n=1 Tax=uncultured Draconibacterium sp. TaxID=1573823 RepID=UPI0032180B6B